MHHFNHFAAVTLAATLLSGCPETARCGEGETYTRGTGCEPASDGSVPADAPMDAGLDAGPCMGACDLAHCDVDDQRCLECIGDDECDEPTLPICGAEGSCTDCTADAQCARLGLAECHDGDCLDCTPENEDPVCGGFVCNPATGACTTDTPLTTTECLPCVADSNCAENLFCVPMDFMGARRPGGYCLRDFALTCARPYTIEIVGRETLSGTTGLSFCGIDEAQTTCEAVVAFGDPCPTGNDTECASTGATCGIVGGAANTCSYPCGDALECPGIRTCPVASGYCAGPS